MFPFLFLNNLLTEKAKESYGIPQHLLWGASTKGWNGGQASHKRTGSNWSQDVPLCPALSRIVSLCLGQHLGIVVERLVPSLKVSIRRPRWQRTFPYVAKPSQTARYDNSSKAAPQIVAEKLNNNIKTSNQAKWHGKTPAQKLHH